MGQNIQPEAVEYSLSDVYRALAEIVKEREVAMTSQPSWTNQPELALESARSAFDQVLTWKHTDVTKLVTKFAVPSNPNLANRPGLDLVSQIVNVRRQEERKKMGLEVDPSEPTMKPPERTLCIE